MPLIFLDLETTGLNHRQAPFDRILEIAVIVTDDALQEVGRFQRVTSEARNTDFTKVDPFVLTMHAKTGLWAESLVAPDMPINGDASHRLDHVERAVDDFLNWCLPPPPADGQRAQRSILAGNTISFDREFIRAWLPRIEARLHYRMYDVSSLNEFAMRTRRPVWEARPRCDEGSAHRAMADVENSLACARHYAAFLDGES